MTVAVLIPVVGIAKSAFAGIEDSAEVVAVLRGNSRKPLFVTAAGMDATTAANHVRAMAGRHRVPSLARLADRSARYEVAAGRTAVTGRTEA